jgi:hypothetical protein
VGAARIALPGGTLTAKGRLRQVCVVKNTLPAISAELEAYREGRLTREQAQVNIKAYVRDAEEAAQRGNVELSTGKNGPLRDCIDLSAIFKASAGLLPLVIRMPYEIDARGHRKPRLLKSG